MELAIPTEAVFDNASQMSSKPSPLATAHALEMARLSLTSSANSEGHGAEKLDRSTTRR